MANQGIVSEAAARSEDGQTHLLVVRVLDEHVAELELGSVYVLASNEDGDAADARTALEVRDDVAKLGRQAGRQVG